MLRLCGVSDSFFFRGGGTPFFGVVLSETKRNTHICGCPKKQRTHPYMGVAQKPEGTPHGTRSVNGKADKNMELPGAIARWPDGYGVLLEPGL